MDASPGLFAHLAKSQRLALPSGRQAPATAPARFPEPTAGLFAHHARRRQPTPAEADPAGQRAAAYYLRGLRTPAPGQWMSDHLKESGNLQGPVYVAIKVLGDQAAQAKVSLYRRHASSQSSEQTDAKSPVEHDHPAAKVLRLPNVKETMGSLLRRDVQQICLTGSSLKWRVDDELGRPKELWSLPTGTYQPLPPSSAYPDGGYRLLPYFPSLWAIEPRLMNSGGAILPADQVLRTMLPHPLVQYDGLSPLQACDLEVDTLGAIGRARFSTMRRGVNPSTVLEMPAGTLLPDGPDLDRLREEIAAIYGGPDMAGRPAILHGGATLKPYSTVPSEMGWTESWDQLVSFVLSVFGVTKGLAFMSEETTFAALYASLKQFNLFSLCPLLNLLADALNLGLIWPFFGEEYFCEITPLTIEEEITPKDKVTVAATMGVLKNNEVRVALGYEPVEDKWGEERAYSRAVPAEGGPGGAPGAPPGGAMGGEQPPGGDDGVGWGAPASAEGEPVNPADGERQDNPQGEGSLPGRGLLAGLLAGLRR